MDKTNITDTLAPDNTQPLTHPPFILRTNESDLSETKRQKYATRTLKPFNGKNYYVYSNAVYDGTSHTRV